MLNQFIVMRHVTPFKAEVTEKLSLLGTVYDTIEKWMKVQSLWLGLVSVFIGGDIAKQLPGDAARFLKVHKIWLKIMERANEQRNVIQCCNDDILVSSLSSLQADLEHCQKQLESYLDGKRGLFPRFYFCSPEDLLKILSLGSDPEAVQDDFEKLFQAITQVTFDEENPKLITQIHQRFSGTTEDVVLYEDVLAEGPIEEWLNDLTDEMMRTIRSKCKIGAQDCSGQMPLPEFVNGSAS
jgi:dynein heavy chain